MVLYGDKSLCLDFARIGGLVYSLAYQVIEKFFSHPFNAIKICLNEMIASF